MATGTGTEIELKLRVPDRASLLAVGAAAGGVARSVVTQENHFFDTEDWHLRAAGFGLRLRDEGGRWFLTAKGPARAGSTATISARREDEVELPDHVALAILTGDDEPIDVLARHGDERAAEVARRLADFAAGRAITRLGSFTNLRSRIDAELGGVPVTLELDETTFPGGVIHHEVEVEVGSLADAHTVGPALDALLARAGVRGQPGSGKAARFFRTLEGLPL